MASEPTLLLVLQMPPRPAPHITNFPFSPGLFLPAHKRGCYFSHITKIIRVSVWEDEVVLEMDGDMVVTDADTGPQCPRHYG